MPMRWRLNELLGLYESKTGERLTYKVIVEGTGLSKTTLSQIATNQATRADLETISVLLAYFSEKLGEELNTNDLLVHKKGGDSERRR